MASLPKASWLRALPPAARFAFHGEERARRAMESVWGIPFAESACRANSRGSRATLWLGPNEYLLMDCAQDARLDVNTLESALGDIPHALVDIGHRQSALEISGPHAAEILNGACPLDLDIGAFPVDACTRTVLAKADIVLWRTRSDAFHLEVWRSFVPYANALLLEIGIEFTDSGATLRAGIST
jgi:sarcosine oxidase, subunit gamma